MEQSEHRLFSFVSINRKGPPLVSYEAVVNLIGSTTTRTGLKVRATLDKKGYETGQKVTDDEMKASLEAPYVPPQLELHPELSATIVISYRGPVLLFCLL